MKIAATRKEEIRFPGNACDVYVKGDGSKRCEDLPYTVDSSPASILPDGKGWRPPFTLPAVNMSGFLEAC